MAINSKPTETGEWGSGQTVINGWEISTAYTLNTFVTNGGSVYKCATAGTSASSGNGPSGTSTSITDGTAVWSYSHPAYRAGPIAEPSAYQKSQGLAAGKEPPTGVLNWLFWLCWKWQLYLQTLAANALTWTNKHTFSQTLVATNSAGTAWQSSTAYAVDAIRNNDSGKIYICTTAGTSASSGGPTGTNAAITDGTVVWMYLRSAAPAITGTSSVSGQAGVRGVGDGTGAAPGLATADVLLFENLASDPSAPVEGQVWYNSTSHTWKGRKNGSTVTFTTS